MSNGTNGGKKTNKEQWNTKIKKVKGDKNWKKRA